MRRHTQGCANNIDMLGVHHFTPEKYSWMDRRCKCRRLYALTRRHMWPKYWQTTDTIPAYLSMKWTRNVLHCFVWGDNEIVSKVSWPCGPPTVYQFELNRWQTDACMLRYIILCSKVDSILFYRTRIVLEGFQRCFLNIQGGQLINKRRWHFCICQ